MPGCLCDRWKESPSHKFIFQEKNHHPWNAKNGIAQEGVKRGPAQDEWLGGVMIWGFKGLGGEGDGRVLPKDQRIKPSP